MCVCVFPPCGFLKGKLTSPRSIAAQLKRGSVVGYDKAQGEQSTRCSFWFDGIGIHKLVEPTKTSPKTTLFDSSEGPER